MYPIVQIENNEIKVVGLNSVTYDSYIDKNYYDSLIEKQKKEKLSLIELDDIKKTPIKKISEGFIMDSEKIYYYEDGDFKEGNE